MAAIGDAGRNNRWASVLGFAISIGVLVLVGWISPDEGATWASLRQGVAIAVVFAAAPLAVWIAPTDPLNLVSVGGAWFVTGAATMQGGNVLMALSSPMDSWSSYWEQPSNHR